MQKNLVVSSVLMALSLAASVPAHAAGAPAKAAAKPTLDKHLPAKLAGWRTDAPTDPHGAFDHTVTVNRTYTASNKQGGLDIQIHRATADSVHGLPRLDDVKPGPTKDGMAVISLHTIKDHKAQLVYSPADKGGKVLLVAGTCSVVAEGHGGVTEAQLIAAMTAVDLPGLDAVCK